MPAPLHFGPFVLDEAAARLTRDGRPVDLRPKPFELLCALARRPGELVSKDRLLDEIWGRRFITEGVIKTAVAELREALGDDARTPRYVETVSRRGYRFCAPLLAAPASGAPVPASPLASLPGREAALQRLWQAWTAAAAGRRRLVLVSGEPGVGKSALIQRLVAALPGDALVAGGQCVESYGGGEAYLPWLEALGALAAREPALLPLMRQAAPTWLAQMPWLLAPDEAAPAATPERMPRELAALLLRLSERAPVLLWLEDLHWSDHASVQLLDHLVRQRAAARLMIVGSLRVVDAVVSGHPLADARREWRLHGLVDEFALEGLEAAALRQLLAERHPGADWPDAALDALAAHTEGLPLFVLAVLDSLTAAGVLASDGARWRLSAPLPTPLPLPDSLSGLFEKQLSTLEPTQRELLEAAAVAGVEFDGDLLAQALGWPLDQVQRRCDGLVRGGRWLRSVGVEVRPGQPASARYRFGHALMQQVCLRRCGAGRRAEWHRAAAAVLLARPEARPADLAYHLEQAQDWTGALVQLDRAALRAQMLAAGAEIVALAERAERLLPRCTDAAQQADFGFRFALHRFVGWANRQGYASAAAGEAARRLLALAEANPLADGYFNAARALWLHHLASARFDEARGLADRVLARVPAGLNAGWRTQALAMLYYSALKGGDLPAARAALDESNAVAPQVVPRHAAAASFYRVLANERRVVDALLAELQGQPWPDLAALRQEVAGAALTLARVHDGLLLEILLAWRGEAGAVEAEAHAALALIDEQGYESGAAMHQVMLHWAQGMQAEPDAALARLRDAAGRCMAAGLLAERTVYLDLEAELALRAGRPDEALRAVDEGLAHAVHSGERYAEPRLRRHRAAALKAIEGGRAA